MKTIALIDKFLKRGKIQELAASTLAKYRQQLTHWAQDMPPEIEEITFDDLLEYFAAWAVKPKTKRNTVVLVKQLYNFAFENYGVPNVARNLPLPRLQKRKPVYLTKAELEKLIALARAPKLRRAVDVWYSYRNVALIIFLADTGLRIGELCQMRRADVHLAERTAYVRAGKTGAGWVVFGARSITALQEHWARQITGEYVIENYDGSPLSILGAERLCTRLSKRLGKHITPHKLRHTCATAMATNGVHLKVIQEQLRHKRIESTMIYTHVDLQDRIDAHAVFE